MRTVLLDTNAYTALLAGSEAVLDALAEAETVFASTKVLGELYAGFKGAQREQENNRLLEEFLRRSDVRCSPSVSRKRLLIYESAHSATAAPR